jgi:O-antigen/teichoic acid export membrane protein
VLVRTGLFRIIRDVALESKWVVVGLFLFMVSLQMVPWLVTADLGIAAAGFYAACLALANAANPLVTGFINAMMPAAALHFADGARPAAASTLRTETVALGLVTGGVAVFVMLFSRPLLAFVYGGPFGLYSGLLSMLALSFLARSIGAAPYLGLWALGRADRNAAINLGIVVVAGVVALVLMPFLGVWGAGLGVLTADIAGAAVRWFLFACLARAQGKSL